MKITVIHRFVRIKSEYFYDWIIFSLCTMLITWVVLCKKVVVDDVPCLLYNLQIIILILSLFYMQWSCTQVELKMPTILV